MPRKRHAYRLIVPGLILCAGLIVGSFGQTLDNADVLRVGIVLSVLGLLGLLIGKLMNYSARHSRSRR